MGGGWGVGGRGTGAAFGGSPAGTLPARASIWSPDPAQPLFPFVRRSHSGSASPWDDPILSSQGSVPVLFPFHGRDSACTGGFRHLQRLDAPPLLLWDSFGVNCQ